jgi:hypothetical protein
MGAISRWLCGRWFLGGDARAGPRPENLAQDSDCSRWSGLSFSLFRLEQAFSAARCSTILFVAVSGCGEPPRGGVRRGTHDV